jgi:ArsR family transcriptional regulator
MSRRDANTVFTAFADERRVRILHLLRHGETCVGDLVAILDLPQSTVSRHLAILRRAGLVSCREEGLWRHYRLAAPESPLHAHLLSGLGRCFDDVPALAADGERAKSLRAAGGCCPPSRSGTPVWSVGAARSGHAGGLQESSASTASTTGVETKNRRRK